MEGSKLKIFIFLVLFLLPLGAQAQQRIVNLDFVGLSQARETFARSQIASVEGTLYSVSQVNEDIKKLYETGAFQDIFIEKREIAGGLRLIFHVTEKGTIRGIVFRGNDKIKEKDLLNALTIRDFNLLDEKRIAESIQAIRKLYEDKGYYLVEISHEIQPYDTEKNELELIFKIEENRGVKVKRISFVGNKVFKDRKLAHELKTKVGNILGFLTGAGKIKDEKLEADVQLLNIFYLTRGYLKAKIGKPQITLTRNKDALYITFPVFEGPQYKVGRVGIGGEILTTEEELLSKIKLKTGEIYNKLDEETDRQYLEILYGDQAYAFARIEPVVTLNDETLTADTMYSIEKGPKVWLEKIEITGNDVTRDKVIRREIQIAENSPYNKSAIDLSRIRLLQLGYFEDVNFSIPRGTRDDTVVLKIAVKEKNTGTFSIGAGFSSLESFIFTASVQKDNFFGLGIRGSVAANISKLRQEFQLGITDRYFLDTHWIFSGAAYRYTSALNYDFDQKAFGGSLSFGREVFPFFDVNLGYQIEDVEITNFSSRVPAFFQETASGLTSSLQAVLSYDRRDNRVLTTKGAYNSVTLGYAGQGLGGDNDFWKVEAETRWFFKLPAKSIFKVRGFFGYVNSTDDKTVPLFERYFLGGINSLRGFDLNTIGPKLHIPSSATGADSDFVFGGTRKVMVNSELEVPIYDPAGIRSVIFFDAGQAFSENENISILKLRANYGFGLRWNSPFGPLRFEWGFPINRKPGESFSVFNFSIGQSF